MIMDKCCNCSSTDRLMMIYIIPLEMGGNDTTTNIATICRRCEMIRKTEKGYESDNKTFARILVSKPIGSWVITKEKVGSIVREVVQKFISNPDAFSDLPLYQSNSADSISLNVWLDKNEYSLFKKECDKLNLSLKEGLTGLLTIKRESLGE